MVILHYSYSKGGHMSIAVEAGKMVRELREKGLTRYRIAAGANLSWRTIALWEKTTEDIKIQPDKLNLLRNFYNAETNKSD